mgnify:CR=1 FL=1
MKVELTTELENELYKVQIKELELDGRYLFIRGIVLDIDKKEAFEFEDSIDVSDFCWTDNLEEFSNASDEDTDKKET